MQILEQLNKCIGEHKEGENDVKTRINNPRPAFKCLQEHGKQNKYQNQRLVSTTVKAVLEIWLKDMENDIQMSIAESVDCSV